MKKYIVLCFLFFIFFSCHSKKNVESPPSTETTKESIYNLKNHPEVYNLKREVVTYTDWEISKVFSFKSNLKQRFLNITFPFPFYVNKVFVAAGDKVQKDQKLFEIKSDELNNVLENYKKTKDQSIEQTLKKIGILPTTPTPLSSVLIISPAEGYINTINVEEQKSYPSSTLTVIRLAGELILEGSIPTIYNNEDALFYILLADNVEQPAHVLEKQLTDNTLKIKLSFSPPMNIEQKDTFPVKATYTLRNVCVVSKNAIVNEGDKAYVFIDKGDYIIEKRSVNGFSSDEHFIITDNIKENEKIFVEDVYLLKKLTN